VLGLKVVRMDGQPVTFAWRCPRLAAAFSIVVLFLGSSDRLDAERQGARQDRGTVV